LATDLGDFSENDESDSTTAEELAERFKDNPEGLGDYRKEKEDKISEKYIDSSNHARWHTGETSEDAQNLRRNIRDRNLEKLNEKCNTASELNHIDTDYSDWTTDREDSPKPGASPSNSEEDTTNKNEGSSSSNLNTVNQESNSTSATEGRFKQDSSDIMPDTEPMDFDDPTG